GALGKRGRSNAAPASSRNRLKTAGTGNDGISAGTNAPARWISVQIGQWSSAGCSRPAGLGGAVRSSADGGVPASALAGAESGAMRSRCTWPNETASWNASANSARYAPNLERDRNQLIVVTLHASHAAAEPFCRRTRELCYSVTMPTIGPRCDSSGVLQKINIARSSVPFHSRGCSRRIKKARRLKRASLSCADWGRALARDRRRAIVRESLLLATARFGTLRPRPRRKCIEKHHLDHQCSHAPGRPILHLVRAPAGAPPR